MHIKSLLNTVTVAALVSSAVISSHADTPAAASDTVPIKVLPSGHISLKVDVDGKGPFTMVLDTGSPITLLGILPAVQFGILGSQYKSQENTDSLVPLGMNSSSTVCAYNTNASVSSMRVLYLNHPIVRLLSKVEGPIDGLLGLSYWGNFRTTLDYADATVTFKPIKYSPPDVLMSVMKSFYDPAPSMPVRPRAQWGMKVVPFKGRGVEISKVFPGGAADLAGLKAGDVLLTLDGRWTDGVAECYKAASFIQPDKTVNAVIMRNGTRMTLQITPGHGL